MGFEPMTYGLGNRCSILLSYRPIISFAHLSPIKLAPHSLMLLRAATLRCYSLM